MSRSRSIHKGIMVSQNYVLDSFCSDLGSVNTRILELEEVILIGNTCSDFHHNNRQVPSRNLPQLLGSLLT